MNRDDVSKLTERIFDVMEQIRSGKQNISDSTFTRFNEDLLNLYYSLTDNPSDVPTTFIGVLD